MTCTGLTVVQTGLPPNATFEVTSLNAANAKPLGEHRVHSNANGRLRVRIHADLLGVRRLHAEVERLHVANSEYGEADVDLNRHCHVVGKSPVPLPRPSPPDTTASPATTADRTTAGGGAGLAPLWRVLIGLGAVVSAAGCGVLVQKRRKLP